MAEAVTNTETGYCDYNNLPEGSAYQGPIKVDIQEGQQGLHISLRTAHLAIETIRAQDINDYESLFTDERVMKTYASGEAKKAGEISKRILGSWIPRWEKKDPFSGMVIRTHEGEFVGHIAMGYGDAMKYGDDDDGITLKSPMSLLKSTGIKDMGRKQLLHLSTVWLPSLFKLDIQLELVKTLMERKSYANYP